MMPMTAAAVVGAGVTDEGVAVNEVEPVAAAVVDANAGVIGVGEAVALGSGVGVKVAVAVGCGVKVGVRLGVCVGAAGCVGAS